MSSLVDKKFGLPFEIVLTDQNKKKLNLSTREAPKKIYPVLIVDNLPKAFVKIDKNNSKKPLKISKEEQDLLNLIARIIVEIFIKEEL